VKEDFLSAHNTFHLACEAARMKAMAREAWTDERLDDLTHRVDEGFKGNQREFQAVRLEMRNEFASVRQEVRTEFASVRNEIGGVRGEIGGLRGDLLALHRLLVRIAMGGFATLVVGILGLIATRL
jgi:hypothetical protein